MHDYIQDRVLELSRHIAETSATVRQTASDFGISKSTVHKDVTERIVRINKPLADAVKQVMNRNKAERPIRGGLATKEKFRAASGAGCRKQVEKAAYIASCMPLLMKFCGNQKRRLISRLYSRRISLSASMKIRQRTMQTMASTSAMIPRITTARQ